MVSVKLSRTELVSLVNDSDEKDDVSLTYDQSKEFYKLAFADLDILSRSKLYVSKLDCWQEFGNFKPFEVNTIAYSGDFIVPDDNLLSENENVAQIIIEEVAKSVGLGIESNCLLSGDFDNSWLNAALCGGHIIKTPCPNLADLLDQMLKLMPITFGVVEDVGNYVLYVPNSISNDYGEQLLDMVSDYNNGFKFVYKNIGIQLVPYDFNYILLCHRFNLGVAVTLPVGFKKQRIHDYSGEQIINKDIVFDPPKDNTNASLYDVVVKFSPVVVKPESLVMACI